MRSKTKGKKGQLSIQFNWIFVLIIGAIILAFFITVIKNQDKRATAEQATDMVQTIDTLFTTIGSNPESTDTFRINNAKLELMCEEGQSRYYIQGAGPIDTTYKALFSATTLRGSQITTWTRSWRVPFEAGTLTYLSDDRTLFIFLTNDDRGNIARLEKELPEAFERVIRGPTTMSSFSAPGYDRYIIITTETISASLNLSASLKDAQVRTIPGEDPRDLQGVFKAGFKQDGSSDVSYALGEELLWAAIFSESRDYYECNAEKAVRKLVALSKILQKRTESLKGEFTSSRCYDFLDSANTAYTNLKGIDITDTFNQQLETIQTNKESLERQQKLIQRGPQCPYLY